VVAIDGGRIVGTRAADGVGAWLGIPYAAPPTGALRWRPPAPVRVWSDVRPAHALAPQCVQPPRAADSIYAEYAGVQPMSEDCLYLNVWSSAPPGERWPVMVWIHGGAFQQGSGANPVFVRGDLPRHGVVLATLNYRLGPFGFMAHPGLSAESAEATSGNYGLLDVAAALAWVQRNIAAFGGDPGQVTVFGQSAGAAAVVDLMASARTQGLFARAIAQSFGITTMRPLADAERSGSEFAARIGATDLAALRSRPAEALLMRYLQQPERWMPIVDGALLDRPVIETFRAGREQPLPLLTGWNRDEGTTFPSVGDAAAFRRSLGKRFGAHAADAERLYPFASDIDARLASQALVGDGLFAWGVWRAARDHARIAPTWLYHFDHAQPFASKQHYAEAEDAADLGVFHSSEYPYVFGTTSILSRDWSDADRHMTALMQALWLSFAKTGRPHADGAPAWPTFDAAAPTVLRLAPTPSLVGVPRRAQLAFLDERAP
jgi:para-nitrobenzyl esterase